MTDREFAHGLYDELPPDRARLAKALWDMRGRLQAGEAWEAVMIPGVESLLRDCAERAFELGFAGKRIGERIVLHRFALPADFPLVLDPRPAEREG